MSALLRHTPRLPVFARLAPRTLQKRGLLTLKDYKYTAHATASGAGRNGNVVSNDGSASPLDLKLSMPSALGGDGKGVNPEQLFASGYASCFLGALQAVAAQRGVHDAAKDAQINVSVHLGTQAGFGIAVDINVTGVADHELVQRAHEASHRTSGVECARFTNIT
ncbi:hypothetical protein BS47DRAFT_1340582 [Hydnum rufescens UP504]|uniref:OsmC-like protein n=1 Tax=Hydnum rufescens UP504 TaxID=1448309 RepID=A0A9P6B3B3_9AGAM|nr:hypothetical protein BS47DRAFT_1340582 [Hydnum rufescens UP504]